MNSAQDSDLAPFLGDWSQTEKLSEIKLPLMHTQRRLVNMLENPVFSLYKYTIEVFSFPTFRYHVPVVMYVLHNFHHLFLVLNSSANFIIYCCVAKDFRMRMGRMLKL